MPKLALKRLTASDLTLFTWQFRNRNAGNQKAINLNANVFVDELFPGVPEVAQSMGNRITLSVGLYGPDMKGVYRIARHIIKGDAYKNWRLNGEFVSNPESDGTRFNSLVPGDYAVMAFHGEAYPTAVDIVFVSATADSDRALHEALGRFIPQGGRRSMVKLEQDALVAACESEGIPSTHPVKQFVRDVEFEEALQDAAFGSAEGTRVARRRRGSRRISSEDMSRARSNAERIGRDGEELVNLHFQERLQAQTITAFSWVSQTDAAAPHDFEITELSGQRTLVDAKSTEGDFQRSIHISAAELAEAAESDVPYSIYRVYQMNEEGGLLRVAPDIREFARQLQGWVAQLPQGVAPDGFTLSPGTLEWETEVSVHRLDDGEGEG